MAPTLSLPHSTFQKNTNVQIFFISEVSGFAVESKSQRFVPPEASSFHITCVHRKTGIWLQNYLGSSQIALVGLNLKSHFQ